MLVDADVCEVNYETTVDIRASLMAQMVKNLTVIRETQVQSLSQEDPCRRKWQPTPGFLPGKLLGQTSQVGYCPRGHKKLDTTEQLTQWIFMH